MIAFLVVACAVICITCLICRRYWLHLDGGGFILALEPVMAGVSLRHLMLVLAAVAVICEAYVAALGAPMIGAGLLASAAFFLGLAVLCVRTPVGTAIRRTSSTDSASRG